MASIITDKMTDFLTIILTFSLVVLVTKLFLSRRNSPPGPWKLPIIGNLLSLGDNPVLAFHNWYKVYGEIFEIQMGKWTTVVLSGQTIKEALSSKGDEFSGRPGFLSFQKIGDQKSITSGKFGPRYLLQRKIATSVLRMFTVVKRGNPIDEIVQEQANNLVEDFLQHRAGESFDPASKIRLCTASVIYQVCYGRGIRIYDDQDFVDMVKNADDFLTFMKAGNPFDVLPWLRYFMPSRLSSFFELLNRSDKVRKKKLKEHEETFDEKNIRDAADGLILATKQYSSQQKAEVGLEDFYIKVVLGDFMGAGFDTTTFSLSWLILLLAAYPKIQDEVRDELEEVVGTGRNPSVKDRDKLPLTEATIMESLRMGSVAALAIPHATTQDVMFKGYEIPAETPVFLNLYSIHYDPDLWENPRTFNPKRFLTQKGEINQKMVEQLVSFGVGRRKCPGENLARLELFLFFTNIIQKCKLELPKGESVDLDGEFVLVRRPKPFKIIVSEV